MADPACTVVVERTATAHLVTIRGEFDLAALDSVHAAIQPLLADVVVVDLAEITFMDSSALHGLLRLQTEAATRGGRLSIGAVAGVVDRLLQLSGMGDTLRATD